MKAILVAALMAVVSTTAFADEGLVRIPSANPQSPILAGVIVPGASTVYYLSGQVPALADESKPKDSIEAYGDTKTQSISIFEKIKTLLAAQGMDMGDVIKLTVFLVGDPGMGGKMDFKGFNEAYGMYFGTADQPNKIARSTVQVAALASPAFLVEIEATAVKTP